MPISLRPALHCLVFLGLFVQNTLSAQTEMQAWGNITGMRINGNLFRFA